MRQASAGTEAFKTTDTPASHTDGLQLAAVRSGNDKLPPHTDISTVTNLPLHVTAALASQPGTPAQVVVNTPLGQDAWTDDFNQSITWLASQQGQSAQLHLNPPNLGPLDVVLNVSDGQATALFTSPHAAVREAVEQALPRLREMLADSGITLGNAMVSDQSPREQQTHFTNNQLKGRGDVSDKVSGAADVAQSAMPLAERRHQGMVDTFA
jgi:flagellar hook-length control protein FliK